MNKLQLQFLMLIFAGWVNRSQQEVIEYLQAENRVLREQLCGKRLLFTDVDDGFLNGCRYLIHDRDPLSLNHLCKAVTEFTEHYHFERNHQGLNNQLIEKPRSAPNMDGTVGCHERLGGILKYYDRSAG